MPQKRLGIKTLDDQLIALNRQVERYQDLKAKLFQDFKEHVVSSEEYEQIGLRFTKKILEARKSIEEVNGKRERIFSGKPSVHPWIEDFKSYRNIVSLNREILVTLVRRITVYSKDSIKIEFRYADEMEEMLEYALEGMEETEERMGVK